MMKAIPSVTSTWPCSLPTRRRSSSRSAAIPSKPTARPPANAASQNGHSKASNVAPT